MTTVKKDRVVAFNYRAYDGDTLLEDASEGPGILYLHGRSGVFAALQDALEEKEVGDSISVELPPHIGYGVRKPNSIERIPIKHLATKGRLRPGQIVVINTANGPREALLSKAGRFNVDIDTNHPYAGLTVRFDMTVKSIRDATEEELLHGHAHGDGGHHH